MTQASEELKTLFRQKYISLKDDIDALCNMSNVSIERRNSIIEHLNSLLDLRMNMTVMLLIDNGIINERPEDSIL